MFLIIAERWVLTVLISGVGGSKKVFHAPISLFDNKMSDGDNAIFIVVPCHRIVESTGEMVGDAGGLWDVGKHQMSNNYF
ncbi:MAG: MGMT family protein [Bacteroidales bacterium]|nr:MGMT family protein [Bacteroidales bacterium]